MKKSSALLSGLALSISMASCGDGGTNPGNVPDTDFDIELVFIGSGTPGQNATFLEAANRWMNIVNNGLEDVDFSSNSVAANACVQGQPEVSDVVDDLRIYVDIKTFSDGPGGTLGQAGPCRIRTNSQLPVLGFMQLDTADVRSLEQNGDLLDVALHEMGHVLGVGTLWGNFETLLINPSLPSSPGVDTHFSGSGAVAAFDAAGGTAYTGGAKVPVDNGADVGSSDAHWREAALLLELMTPELTPGIGNPLSAITTESLADLGYSVNSSAADPFTRAFPAPSRSPDAGKRMTAPARPRARGPRVIDMGNDAYRGVIEVVDRSGRVVRTMIRR